MKCPNCGHELWPQYKQNRERDEEIKRLYHEENWEPDRLAKKYDLSAMRIKQIIGTKNLRPSTRKEFYVLRRQGIYNDRESGMTFAEIGRKYKLTSAYVRGLYVSKKRREE